MSDRKARLAALAAKAGRTKPELAAPEAMDEDETTATQGTSDQQPQVKFRNYVPTSNALENSESSSPPTKKARTNEESQEDKTKKSSALEQALAKAQEEAKTVSSSNDVAAMGPKKINWDLKRDIQSKMEKLERRTQRAIVELLRERLEKEAAEDNQDEDSDSDLD